MPREYKTAVKTVCTKAEGKTVHQSQKKHNYQMTICLHLFSQVLSLSAQNILGFIFLSSAPTSLCYGQHWSCP